MKAINARDFQLPQHDDIGQEIAELDQEIAERKHDQPCPCCRGAGYFLYEVEPGHKDFGILQICDCKRREMEQKREMQAREAAMLLDRELGLRYQADFASFDTAWVKEEKHRKLLAAVLGFCQTYASEPSGWLMLHGRGGGMCGSGKSHLAAAIARTNAEQGAAYATVPDLFSYILSDWTLAEQRIEALSSVYLLVMDDMGQEAVSGRGVDQFREKFFRVLNNRDRRNLPTVITSNYTLEELGKMDHYSEAVISRLYGQTEGRRILLNVPDYRRKGA